MTIDEHIHKAEDDAMMAVFDTEWGIGNYFIDRTEALEYAKECRQLAEWLKDYKRLLEQEPSGDAVSRDFQIGDEVRIIGSDPIYDDCDVGWVIRNASERVKTMYVMRNDGSADEENKAEWYKTGRHNAMLAEVIKQLPSVKPQESCDVPNMNDGDMISRQAVLDTISELNAISFYEAQEDSKECYYEIRQAIENLSPVKLQEPKTGHWIKTISENGITSAVRCSECGFEDNRYMLFRYCPNCGTRMEVEQNG